MLFSVSLLFYQCLDLNVGTRIALHVRDVGGLGICIMGGSVLFFVPEIVGNEPQYSAGRFAAFLCLFLPLEVFGDDDSLNTLLISCRQLLIGHVIVALHVFGSDVHHRTFCLQLFLFFFLQWVGCMGLGSSDIEYSHSLQAWHCLHIFNNNNNNIREQLSHISG